MKKQIILMILALSLGFGQLIAQNSTFNTSNFRFANTTLSHQVVDSIIATGIATGVPYVSGGFYPLGQVTKSKYSLDSQGNVLNQTDYYISNTSLAIEPVTKKTNTFDANNRMITSITGRWHKASAQFVDSLKSEFTYTTNEIVVETISKLVSSVWVVSDSIKSITTYNANQDATEKITYASIGNVWVDSLKETNTYDSSNRLLTRVIAAWNGSVYINTLKTTMTYNSDGKTASVILQDWNGTTWVNAIYTANVPGLGTFNVNVTTTLTYSTISKTALPVIENSIDATVKTYPNPTVDGFYINAGESTVTVSVISVKGQLLINKEVTGTEYIRVNNIGKGTFLVKITSGEKSVTRKLFVK